MNPSPPLVLVFAASDPSAGAGVQADMLTLASLGCHPVTAITAITVQDTAGVESIHPIDSELLERQARAVLLDMPVAAFKIGVVGSLRNIAAIAGIVAEYPDVPLVFDPVLASGRGDEFSSAEMRAAMSELLLPKTTLLTPNTPEAQRLAARDGERELPDSDECARRLLALGARHVLLTGTHENTPLVVNRLYGPAGLARQDRWERLPGSYHGSGCTLASAAAAFLARGANVEDAVRDAQSYTWQTLSNAFQPGKGQFIPDRFFWTRDDEDGNAGKF